MVTGTKNFRSVSFCCTVALPLGNQTILVLDFTIKSLNSKAKSSTTMLISTMSLGGGPIRVHYNTNESIKLSW